MESTVADARPNVDSPRRPRPVWVALVAALILDAAISVTETGRSSRPSGLAGLVRLCADALASGSLLLVVVAALRPLLGDVRARNAARAVGVASVSIVPARLVLDLAPADGVQMLAGPSARAIATWITVVAGAVAVLALLSLVRGGRTSPLQVCSVVGLGIAAIGLMMHPLVNAATSDVVLRCGPTVLLGAGTLVVMRRPGASLLGRPLDWPALFAAVRNWPFVTATLCSAGFAGTASSSAAFRSAMPIATAAMVGSVGLACRDLSGGSKPLLLPFSGRERAVHRVFATLAQGDVRLVGRPVRRSTDGLTVAVEAVAEWPRTGRRPHCSLRIAAETAGLGWALDRRALDLAVVHAPAVLHGLLGGEPWISVPVAAATIARDVPESFTASGLDGVVARLDRWPRTQSRGHFDKWRDLGLAVHVDAPTEAPESDFDADILTVPPDNESRSQQVRERVGAMLLVRRSATGPSTDPRRPLGRPHLVVNMNEREVDLGVLLSSITVRRPEEYVRRLTQGASSVW